MRTLESRPPQVREILCVACATHMQPEMVPWLQHEIGCPVRTAALGRQYQQPSRRIAHPEPLPH